MFAAVSVVLRMSVNCLEQPHLLQLLVLGQFVRTVTLLLLRPPLLRLRDWQGGDAAADVVLEARLRLRPSFFGYVHESTCAGLLRFLVLNAAEF